MSASDLDRDSDQEIKKHLLGLQGEERQMYIPRAWNLCPCSYTVLNLRSLHKDARLVLRPRQHQRVREAGVREGVAWPTTFAVRAALRHKSRLRMGF